jgi:hypothetical protein
MSAAKESSSVLRLLHTLSALKKLNQFQASYIQIND